MSVRIITTNLLFVWGPERTTGSNLVAADLRARKSTGVTMRLSAIYSFLEVVCACANTAVQTYYSSITQQPVGRRCQEMLPLCCSAGNDSYSHAVSRQEMYAWAARATVISNLDPDGAVWYFYGVCGVRARVVWVTHRQEVPGND